MRVARIFWNARHRSFITVRRRSPMQISGSTLAVAPLRRCRALQQRSVDAARAELVRLRLDETIGDDGDHRVGVVPDCSSLAANGRATNA